MKRGTKERGKQFLQSYLFPVIYKMNKKKEVDKNLVVFADAHHRELPEPMVLLRERMVQQGYRVQIYLYDSAKLSYSEQLRYMTAFMKLYATCGAVVICDNFLPVASCKKRSETKVVQLWHACGALKRFGYDAADDVPPWYRKNVYENYDLVCVSGPACVESFRRAMHVEKEGVVRAIGVSEMDCLFEGAYRNQVRDKFRYFHPDARGKKVLLWAPTFRGAAGDMKSREVIGESAVDALSMTGDYYVIKSLHPYRTTKKPDMSTKELLLCADVLITDYSSVCYPAMMLRLPVVYYAPDLSAYRATRGFYADYESMPGIHPMQGEGLEQAVGRALNAGSALYETPEAGAFLNAYMSGCDGGATERILEFIAGNERY